MQWLPNVDQADVGAAGLVSPCSSCLLGAGDRDGDGLLV